MRNFILTPLEHEIIQSYLDTGTQLEGFRTLIHRIKNNKKTLKKDLVLIDLTLKKYLQTGLDKEEN